MAIIAWLHCANYKFRMFFTCHQALHSPLHALKSSLCFLSLLIVFWALHTSTALECGSLWLASLAIPRFLFSPFQYSVVLGEHATLCVSIYHVTDVLLLLLFLAMANNALCTFLDKIWVHISFHSLRYVSRVEVQVV